MTKTDYINEIIRFIEMFLDNRLEISNNVVDYNCIMCGRSKNNKPHMRVDYNGGFYYCYRCNQGGILYKLIKSFKSNDNRVYINNILKAYFDIYKYDPNLKRLKDTENYKSYDFSVNNLSIIDTNGISDFNDIRFKFILNRFPEIDKLIIHETIKKFRIVFPPNVKRFYYNSIFRKFIYGYVIDENLNYTKIKLRNESIDNDRKDYYYLINSYDAENLYIGEGLFDLMTLSLKDPLHNIDSSNFLALCSRNYKFLFDVLLNSGKFYYKNIYLIIDNDVNKKSFMEGTVNALSNNRVHSKFNLYENFYVITAPRMHVDLNEFYRNECSSFNAGLNISKIF